jgi:hypothetical protein
VKAGPARPVEYATQKEAQAAIEETRQRYRGGARAYRMVRVFDPEGRLRLVDFEREAREAERALRDVQRATAARDQAFAEATDRGEATLARAVELGQAVEDVAEAAGITPRELRTIVRRRERS